MNKDLSKSNTLHLSHQLQQRSERDLSGLLFIEGIRNIIAAYQSGHAIKHILFCKKLYKVASGDGIIQEILTQHHVELIAVDTFRNISQATHASGIAAIIQQRWTSIKHLNRHRGNWLLLRHLQAFGNIGTLIRSAVSLDCKGIMCIGKSIDLYCNDVVRASMGAVFYLPKVRCTHKELLRWKRYHSDWSIIGCSAQAQTSLTEFPLNSANLIYIGHERHGLNDEERACCDVSIKIPMIGAMSSFNAGVAGSIVLYEAWRQQHC